MCQPFWTLSLTPRVNVSPALIASRSATSATRTSLLPSGTSLTGLCANAGTAVRKKQLGTAYLVYPGALHTRFDHSIGSLHMAGRMIEAIHLSHELDPASCVDVGEEEARVIRIAALVHDVTHIPFGHSIEDQDGIFGR